MFFYLRSLAFLAAFLLTVGCASVDRNDVAYMDSYSLCKGSAYNQGRNTAGRAVLGVLTIGISEMQEADWRATRKVYDAELARRGIYDCSANGLATYECNKIFDRTDMPEFKQCVVQIRNTIAARGSADAAQLEAQRARYQAWKAANPSPNQKYIDNSKYLK